MADTTEPSKSHWITAEESKQGPDTDIVSPPSTLPWEGVKVRSKEILCVHVCVCVGGGGGG